MNKRVLIFISFVFISHIIFANDAYVRTAGGAVLPFLESKNKTIKMQSENITITLFDSYYQIDVDFIFFNTGSTEKISVGFPEWRQQQKTNDTFKNFLSSVNDEPVPFEIINPEKPDILGEHIVVTKWYVREIIFPANQKTKTSISYQASYGIYGLSRSIDYLYGTASSWTGSLGEMRIHIINNSKKWINAFIDTNLKEDPIFYDENTFTIIKSNVNPNPRDCLFFMIDSVPSVLVSHKYISFERNWSLDKTLIKESDIKFLTKAQLRILRNLIYAGHGHIFDSKDLNDWLSEYADYWYSPVKKISDSELNDIELKNIQTILAEEKKR